MLPGGSDSRKFLYVGRADSRGEYPVMVVDTDDLPFVCIYCPGFDAWIAEDTGALGFEPRTYDDLYDRAAFRDAMAEQSRLNFGGRRTLELGAGATYIEGLELVTIDTLHGRNPLTGAPIETPIQEPAKGAVSPPQAPGWSHRKNR